MYLVFARKYRPMRFEEVVGQEHVARTLQNAVRNGRVAHAYLFCGSRGVGKTTVARILAKALNCVNGPTAQPCCECDACKKIATGDFIDVREIDGASNRGIDQIRDLRENVGYSPVQSRFKVYYIDEVHMLTKEAFNALLKTLEEPPGHVKFIFSTTDPQRVPETVRSRCQRFDFRRISDAQIVRCLEGICEQEEITPEKGSLEVIARAARGSLRDALSTLDQLAALSQETLELSEVLQVLGAVRGDVVRELVDALAREDAGQALRVLHEVLFAGTDVLDFADQLSEYLRDLLVASYGEAADELLAGAAADLDTLKRQAALFSADQLMYMIQLLREAKLRARRETTGRLALELAIIKMSGLSRLVVLEEALGELPEPARGASPRGARPATGNPSADAGATAALRKIRSRLQNARGVSGIAETKAADPVPAGVDEVQWRRIQRAAPDRDAAREVADEAALLKAFSEANGDLALEPISLQRLKDDGGQEEREDAAGRPKEAQEDVEQ